MTNAQMATELGIGMVHQHFMLVEPFTVTENIVLGNEVTRGMTLDLRKASQMVEELSTRYQLAVDPHAKIEDISVGMQQRVEILKTLYRGADILIFDEPTAVLTPQEIVELMEIMRQLKAEGKSIIFITHKLKEIMAVADRVTVIRRGKTIATVAISETGPQQLATMMVGREIQFGVPKGPASVGSVVLEVQNVSATNSRGLSALKDVSLEVRAGEIVGIAGVEGNGQSELIEAITGLRPVQSGSIKLNGHDITHNNPRQVFQSGVGHIPEDRHKRGLVLEYSVADNVVLNRYYEAPFSRSGMLQPQEIDRHAQELARQFDVRTPSVQTPARSLSGGNQQKAIIAREVDRDPDLLIAAQPTRGLDVGAIEFIHRKLIEQRDRGKAVLLMSLELDEILNLSDRIVVMYEGEIIGTIDDPAAVSEDKLGLMMAGSKKSSDGGQR